MPARSRRKGGTVRVTCRRAGDDIAVIVEDDGPGIRPDALEKIFERFYTDRPQQSFGQNSGLGLSISKQIVEAHGGRLTAENRIAAGRRRAAKSRAGRMLHRAPAGPVTGRVGVGGDPSGADAEIRSELPRVPIPRIPMPPSMHPRCWSAAAGC